MKNYITDAPIYTEKELAFTKDDKICKFAQEESFIKKNA